MKDCLPTLAQLLGDDVAVIHCTKRPYFEKRLVEHDGERYVLYCFSKREHLELLAETLAAARRAGALLQPVLGVENSRYEASGSYWLALTCLPGHLLTWERFASGAAASLGQTLARLHSVRGTYWHSLFRWQKPSLPYYAFLRVASLNSRESRWVEDSERKVLKIAAFQLVHGDLHGKNIVIGPDRRAALIDYELFAYEPLGLELATALLQPFCRSEIHRDAFLDAYLVASNGEARSNWNALSHALLFAAAIRLADARKQRVGFLKYKNFLLSLRFWLAIQPRMQLENEKRKNLQLIEQAEKRGEIYFRLARNIVRLSLEKPDMAPSQLISAAYLA